ncbi:hypothetical protein ASF69_13820 [Rhizobium sp. Leaf311]|uniref:ABC transporter permease n=1 Tax=Rhizobium sp. Leaf311 TaxID=1736332 RepID=UPI0007138B9B|nr:ABC transporter permease [Rhizobium sp. Leaf311]KQQ58468.1 hypothetical protein ASF69_13820 [Rhizobium sp. Leaf311]
MMPSVAGAVSPTAMIKTLWMHRGLIAAMTKRALIARYKGSVMGVLWTLINPLLMLSIYSFMFIFVFSPKWQAAGDGSHQSSFVPILFIGLIIHAFFAEIVNNSPNLVNSNVNFVKKIVFPLEILSAVCVLSALINSFVAWLVLICVQNVLGSDFHGTAILFPVIMIPFAVLSLGLSWAIASLGVFVRDIAQIAGFVVSASLFLSPIFYPVSALPEIIKPLIQLNPITFVVEQARRVTIYGDLPVLMGIAVYTIAAIIVAYTGFFLFQKLRKGFADVL